MILMVNKTNIVECRVVVDFLDIFNSTGTANSYKSYLYNYFKWLNITNLILLANIQTSYLT
jgi:hypothetical protein